MLIVSPWALVPLVHDDPPRGVPLVDLGKYRRVVSIIFHILPLLLSREACRSVVELWGYSPPCIKECVDI